MERTDADYLVPSEAIIGINQADHAGRVLTMIADIASGVLDPVARNTLWLTALQKHASKPADIAALREAGEALLAIANDTDVIATSDE